MNSEQNLYITCVLGALMLGLLLAPVAGLAQIVTPAISTGEEEKDTWTSVSYQHLFSTDIDDRSVDFDREAVLALVGHRFKLGEDWGLLTQAAYQLTDYNFTDDSGSLWEDIHQFTVTAILTYQMNDAWTLLGGGIFRLSGEGGADFDEALTGGGVGGFLYRASDTFRGGLLIGAMSQIEGSTAVVPLPLVNWQMADAWRFKLGIQQLGAVGYGPEVIWTASDAWEFGVGASYQKRRYRLDFDEFASIPDGVGEETSVPVFARVGWSPTTSVLLELTGGVAFGGEIRHGDSSGTKILKEDYDPAPIVGLRGHFLF
jgi:hypothetical protein